MRPSVKYKQFLTQLLATGVVVARMMAVMTGSFEQGFVRFVSAQQQDRIESLAAHLSDVCRRGEGWGGLRGNRPCWISLLWRSRSLDPEGRRSAVV